MTVPLDEEGGGEEETSARHGHEGAEQQRELQRAKLPEERVPLPQRVRDLVHTGGGQGPGLTPERGAQTH